MLSTISSLFRKVLIYSFGLFNLVCYAAIAVGDGSYFHRETEREKHDLTLARDRFWNLSERFDGLDGLSHCFYTLKKSGRKLHYLCNNPNRDPAYSLKPLIFLFHGFPDTCAIWRQLFRLSSILEDATVIAVDLPGCGGSDSFPSYGATEVLEALTEFIVEMRETYYQEWDGFDSLDSTKSPAGKTFIVGHDWGCVLAYRLAAEAPYLADRFIVTNGPHPQLAWSNKDRTISSTSKMLATCYHDPLNSRVCFRKVFSTAKPLTRQLFLFGYIFAFQLPNFLVSYLLHGGNRAFLRGCHASSFGRDKAHFNAAECMASTLGPSVYECSTATSTRTTTATATTKTDPPAISFGATNGSSKPQTYSHSVLQRAQRPSAHAAALTALYRDGAALRPWNKSLETLASLHNLETMYPPSPGTTRRHSSGASLFEEPVKGALKAPTTILWGAEDEAVTREICLDGIGDYLAKGSEVVVLKGVGHWVVLETSGVRVLGAVLRDCFDGGGGVLGMGIGRKVKEECEGVEVEVEVVARK